MSSLLTAFEGDMRHQGRVNKNEKIDLAFKSPERVDVVDDPSYCRAGTGQVSQ